MADGRNLSLINNCICTREGIIEMVVASDSSLLNGIRYYWKMNEPTGARRVNSVPGETSADLINNGGAARVPGLENFITDFDSASSQYLSLGGEPEFPTGPFFFSGFFALDDNNEDRVVLSKARLRDLPRVVILLRSKRGRHALRYF